ncbi:hypothetical protein BGW80DRAFT_1292429 [Lactifluus volemus]|nr:hypothetical protein BGW80DRAFT_1292429 [Lactifluus volemus]
MSSTALPIKKRSRRQHHGRGRTRVLQSRGWRRDHLDMDSPVFRKLQEAIEHPCRSRERFALAEQAISTACALGDQPEVLSNTLIKILSRRRVVCGTA